MRCLHVEVARGLTVARPPDRKAVQPAWPVITPERAGLVKTHRVETGLSHLLPQPRALHIHLLVQRNCAWVLTDIAVGAEPPRELSPSLLGAVVGNDHESVEPWQQRRCTNHQLDLQPSARRRLGAHGQVVGKGRGAGQLCEGGRDVGGGGEADFAEGLNDDASVLVQGRDGLNTELDAIVPPRSLVGVVLHAAVDERGDHRAIDHGGGQSLVDIVPVVTDLDEECVRRGSRRVVRNSDLLSEAVGGAAEKIQAAPRQNIACDVWRTPGPRMGAGDSRIIAGDLAPIEPSGRSDAEGRPRHGSLEDDWVDDGLRFDARDREGRHRDQLHVEFGSRLGVQAPRLILERRSGLGDLGLQQADAGRKALQHLVIDVLDPEEPFLLLLRSICQRMCNAELEAVVWALRAKGSWSGCPWAGHRDVRTIVGRGDRRVHATDADLPAQAPEPDLALACEGIVLVGQVTDAATVAEVEAVGCVHQNVPTAADGDRGPKEDADPLHDAAAPEVRAGTTAAPLKARRLEQGPREARQDRCAGRPRLGVTGAVAVEPSGKQPPPTADRRGARRRQR
mmetsp:Transcript_143646/g.459618  ORF Transcript_143646/g.459618 Transcript_143646/m.459618 type:complete len:565 (+) Transcript_143646:3190-4884(+)